MIDDILKRPVTDMDLRKPVCVPALTTIREAAALLQEHAQGVVFVVEKTGALTGVFTERDLLNRVDESGTSDLDRPISEFMNMSLRTAKAGATIADVIREMDRGGCRHLPMVDSDRKPTAVVSIRDILSHLVEEFPQAFINLPPDPRH
jgi:CBS domain-containing protein